MWPATFEARLNSWHQLRESAQDLPADQSLAAINAWWFGVPWRAYYLHWDDQPTWPDPWQLLHDNCFCSVARGLGILYTIALLDRPDITGTLVDTGSDNLVLINGEKYILNWDRDQIVNINLPPYRAKHRLRSDQVKTQIK